MLLKPLAQSTNQTVDRVTEDGSTLLQFPFCINKNLLIDNSTSFPEMPLLREDLARSYI